MKRKKAFLIKLRDFCVTFSASERASKLLTSHLNPDNAVDCAKSVDLGLSGHARSIQIDDASRSLRDLDIARGTRHSGKVRVNLRA